MFNISAIENPLSSELVMITRLANLFKYSGCNSGILWFFAAFIIFHFSYQLQGLILYPSI